MRTNSFVVLTGWAIELLECFGVDDSVSLTLFCHIHALTTNEGTRGGFDGTLSTLAFWTRSKSKNRVMRALERLVSAGLLLKETETQNNILHCKYRSNLSMIEAFLRTDKDRIQNEYTVSKMDMGISKMNTGYIQNEYGGISKTDTHKKKGIKETAKSKEKEREREHTRAQEDTDTGSRLIAAALEPKESDPPSYGFEIPTTEEVESTLRNITVRPPEEEIQLCAGYFIDHMERNDWKPRDWRNALRRYAQRWIQRGNKGSYTKQGAPKPQTSPPQEWTPDSEPPIFTIWPIELGGTIEKNEENLRRYLDAEVLEWERKHGRKVSWRQAADWKEKLFAPLLRRLEKERKNQ